MKKYLIIALVCLSAIAQNSEEQARQALESRATGWGLTIQDVDNAKLDRTSQSKHSKVQHFYFQQNHQGIDVFNGIAGIHLNSQGEVVHSNTNFTHQLANRAPSPAPAISASDAISVAMNHLGEPGQLNQIQQATGPMQSQLFDVSSTKEPVEAKLNYFASEDGVILVWRLNIQPNNSYDWWDLLVDANSGQVVNKVNWTIEDAFMPSSHYSGHKNTPIHEGPKSKGVSSQYRALPLPVETPNHGALELLEDPFDVTASPFGWHDTNGAAGPEFTTTQGNNVHAYQDRDGNDSPAGDDPDGGPSLTFDIAPDFNLAPNTYTDAATINLFVWNNYVHDVYWHLGFDEAAGNFQENNYGNGGSGSDSVNAQSQSGADLVPPNLNNANFSTPPDGFNPRMRMFEWSDPLGAKLIVNAPVSIADDYFGSTANFGNPLPTFPSTLAGNLELVDDATGASNQDACEALVGFTPGNIAILDRGSCEFGVKVLNAENAGAIGAIVVNNAPGQPITMGPGASGGSVTIPSMMVTMEDGLILKNALAIPETVSTEMTLDARPNRDSDYDNGIIAHEYGHGISNRLTGGPNNTSCLGNNEQMGEGWSDFIGLYLTTTSANTATEPRGIGTYPSFQETDGPGIRNFPYSTDTGVNPFTYADISTVSVPHGVGSVWCTMLWDMYWGLVDAHGFDDDLYTGTGGNNLAMQLIMDGMKLQPCNPGFVDGRDAILAADQALTGGQNQCIIWEAFAARGLGEFASQGSSNVVGDETEDFTVPNLSCCSAVLITEEPSSNDYCEESMITLEVVASGTDLEYQWKLDNTDIPSATNATYTIASLNDTNEGTYTCVVTNTCSSETTTAAVIGLIPLPTYGTTHLPNWLQPTPATFCVDTNGNGVLDILDLVDILNPI